MERHRAGSSCSTVTKATGSSSARRAVYFSYPRAEYHRSDWNFFSGPDPTHGNVAYQTRENSEDLAYVDEDCTVVLRVDNEGSVPAGGQRRS
jgi:hypothetical protein